MSTMRRSNQIITLVVACLGFFMVLLDASIVTVALPTIQNNLHTNLSDLQWAVDAYTLPFAALMLTAGTFGDRFGRKRLFLIGLVIFLVGSTLCGFAPTLTWFIIGRVVQGIGAAALSPGSLSVLVAAFPEPRSRAQALGIWSGISGMALAAGPLIGGLLIQVSSWPAIFFVNIPVGVVALALGLPLLSESRNPAAQRLDLRGQILAVGSLVCLITALIESSTQGWTSGLIIGLLVGCVVFLAAFLLVEARASEPMLPLGLFKNWAFSVANVVAVIVGFALLGTVFFVAQYFQSVQGMTALESGLHTLPITIGTFVVAPFAGRLAARPGPRLPIVLGTILAGTALFLLINIAPTSDYSTIWWILGLLGIGFGFTLSPLTVAVLSATPPTRAGLGSSMINTSRQVGSTLGIAVLGSFVVQQFSTNIVTQLTQLGMPVASATRIASRIASAGAQAIHIRIPLPPQFPLPLAAVHQAIALAFVDSLHGTFIISSVGLFAAAILVRFLLQMKKPDTATARPSVPDLPKATVTSVGQE
jgi:EmrB/QacA subfamily drug resistance transporter